MPTPSPTNPKTPSLAQKLRALLQGTPAETSEVTDSAPEAAVSSDSQVAEVAALQAQLDATLAELDVTKKALAENETLQAQWAESQARNAEMLALLDAYALGEPLGDDLASLTEDIEAPEAAVNHVKPTAEVTASTFVPAEMARIAQSLR
jgi:hypothetical protein